MILNKNGNMTIDKSKTINIPVWLVSVALPLIIALITSYVVMTSRTAGLEADNAYNKQQIEMIHQSKADKDIINLVMKKLDQIDTKLEVHLDECTKLK